VTAALKYGSYRAARLFLIDSPALRTASNPFRFITKLFLIDSVSIPRQIHTGSVKIRRSLSNGETGKIEHRKLRRIP